MKIHSTNPALISKPGLKSGPAGGDGFSEFLKQFEKLNHSISYTQVTKTLDTKGLAGDLKGLFSFQRQAQRLHFVTELTSRTGESLAATVRRLQQMG